MGAADIGHVAAALACENACFVRCLCRPGVRLLCILSARCAVSGWRRPVDRRPGPDHPREALPRPFVGSMCRSK